MAFSSCPNAVAHPLYNTRINITSLGQSWRYPPRFSLRILPSSRCVSNSVTQHEEAPDEFPPSEIDEWDSVPDSSGQHVDESAARRPRSDLEFEGVKAQRKYKYRIVIAYDGSAFSGWQRQTRAISVQSEIESKLKTITSCQLRVLGLVGAGRTDAGVHARGQVAHFFTKRPLENIVQTHRALNSMLPQNISILQLAAAKMKFHAGRDASAKTYHYSVYNAPVMDPLKVGHSVHVNVMLDREAMAEAASYFVGQHDFTTFANEMFLPYASKIRTIYRFDLVSLGDEEFRFEVEGNGFLYKQVRNMVGLLLAIGEGRSPPSIVPKLIETKERTFLSRISPVAPAHGLCLQHVKYPFHALEFPPLGPHFISKGMFPKRSANQKVLTITDDLEMKVEFLPRRI